MKPAGVGLGDQELELVRRAAAPLGVHVDAEQAQDPVGHAGEHEDERMEQPAEGLERAGHPSGHRLGAIDGVELGDHLAGDELRGGDDQEGDGHGDGDRDIAAQGPAEGPLEDGREGGLAEGADSDRGHGHPDLDGGDVLVDVAQLIEREPGPAGALLAHDFKRGRGSSARARTRRSRRRR